MFQAVLWFLLQKQKKTHARTQNANSDIISAPKLKGFSGEIIKFLAASNSAAPLLNYVGNRSVKFDESCLKQEKLAFTHKNVVNIYIVYEIYLCPFNVGRNFALGSFFFGAVKLTMNADFDKYNYSGFGIRL